MSTDTVKGAAPHGAEGGEAQARTDAIKVTGYLRKLDSGATVWLARLKTDAFAVKFVSAAGDVTAFSLSPEAMQALMELRADLTSPEEAYLDGESYLWAPKLQWSAVIPFVATVLDSIKSPITPTSEAT